MAGGHARLFDTPELQAAKAHFEAGIYKATGFKRPNIDKACELHVVWQFSGKSGWKTTRPDLSNLVKTIEDRLVATGVLKDDNVVARLVCEKVFGKTEAIEIRISTLESETAPAL